MNERIQHALFRLFSVFISTKIGVIGMGGGSSIGQSLGMSTFVSANSFYEVHPKLSRYKDSFDFLQITEEELVNLYDIYQKIDENNSGTISSLEFLMYFDLDRTKFAVRAFGLFDEDKSGELDFREFVISVWNYGGCNKEYLTEFAFRLYDLDESGYIDVTEMETVVKELYGSKKYEHNPQAKAILDKIKFNATFSDKEIGLKEFVDFSYRHPAMLFPAFKLQYDVREKIMTENFWLKAEKNKRKLNDGGSINLMRVLMDLNTGAFNGGKNDEDLVGEVIGTAKVITKPKLSSWMTGKDDDEDEDAEYTKKMKLKSERLLDPIKKITRRQTTSALGIDNNKEVESLKNNSSQKKLIEEIKSRSSSKSQKSLIEGGKEKKDSIKKSKRNSMDSYDATALKKETGM